MRKSIILLLVSLASALCHPERVYAVPITRQQAQKSVEIFLKKKGKTLRVQPVWRRSESGINDDMEERIYFFNVGNSSGYVIASGDDSTPAILGYTDRGSYDEDSIPDNMKSWLKEYERQIEYNQKKGASSIIKSSSSHSKIPPLLSTKWDQGDPYNLRCPIQPIRNQRCVTGCVATAMAQVMYYHREKSVNKTTREIPGYICKEDGKVEITVESFPEGSVIDWNNMLNSYDGSETQIQKEAVANLIAYCGAAVKTGYGTGSSVALIFRVPTAFQEYFNYSETTMLIKRVNYSDNEWDELIYSELAKGNPIFYSGQTDNVNVGHAFVCDGYDGDGYYHINWGWGGYSDGNFLLSACNPSEQGIGGFGTGYNMNQQALFGAVPKDPNNNQTYSVSITSNGNGSVSVNGKYTISNSSKTIFVDEGNSVTMIMTPNENNRIKSITVNGFDVTSSVSNNTYTIDKINENTTIEVLFEEIETLNPDMEAYVVFTDEILTFYYDKDRNYRNGTTYSMNSGWEFPGWIWEKIDDGYSRKNTDNIKKVVFDNSFALARPSSTLCWFDHCRNLKEIEGMENLNTSQVTNMSSMFSTCKSLNTIDVSNFDTKNVENYYEMFGSCSSLKFIDISNFSIKKNASISSMFTLCTNLTEIKENLPDDIDDLECMYYRCSNLSSVRIPKGVKSISKVDFYFCNSLKTVISEIYDPFDIDDDSFQSVVYSNATLKVPFGKKSAYLSKKGWKKFINIVEMPKTTYTLKYVVDGVDYKSIEYEKGDEIIPESAPQKEGYTFSGWSEIPATMPAHDVTVTGSFAINKYKLTYKVDGVVYKSYEIEYRAAITPEPDPTKEGHTFSGWSWIPTKMPAENVTISGSFTINQYTITYIIDGEVYQTLKVDYNSKITPPTPPEKEGFDFAWGEYPETMPAHDITITGTYTTGVMSIEMESGTAKIFTLEGKQVEQPKKGINIVRMNDGRVQKVVVK